MKPIKCWVVTDGDGNTYSYGNRPVKKGEYWEPNDGGATSLGQNLVSKTIPVKCVIITEQHYKELLEEARLK